MPEGYWIDEAAQLPAYEKMDLMEFLTEAAHAMLSNKMALEEKVGHPLHLERIELENNIDPFKRTFTARFRPYRADDFERFPDE